MKNDLRDAERPISKSVKRTLRRPRKIAAASEELRGWAKSAVKARNKS